MLASSYLNKRHAGNFLIRGLALFFIENMGDDRFNIDLINRGCIKGDNKRFIFLWKSLCQGNDEVDVIDLEIGTFKVVCNIMNISNSLLHGLFIRLAHGEEMTVHSKNSAKTSATMNTGKVVPNLLCSWEMGMWEFGH